MLIDPLKILNPFILPASQFAKMKVLSENKRICGTMLNKWIGLLTVDNHLRNREKLCGTL